MTKDVLIDFGRTLRLYLFRLSRFVRHNLTAFNTKGEGIHSPYLFYWVSMCMYDDNRYYIWREIEKQRNNLMGNTNLLTLTDYGIGNNRPSNRMVNYIAATSLQDKRHAQLLFRLVQFVGGHNNAHSQEHKPLNIIELGTSLGITTAYLAAPHSANHITTYEGSKSLISIAQHNWKELQLHNITAIEGNIDQTLAPSLTTPVDIAFIDANHRYEPLMRYWNTLLPFATRKSVFVIDDIHSSPEMEKAWNEIKNNQKVTSTMDICQMGFVFFDTDYLHKHYRLRF